MDQIRIENLEVFAKYGVSPAENVPGQKFLVSVTLYTDTKLAARTDELSASIEYGKVCQFIDLYMKTHTHKLIERVAECLASELLLHTEHLQKIELEIKKPWARVGQPLEYVSVKIKREWHTAYIALASNVGEKAQYLSNAVKSLDTWEGCRVKGTSSWFVTAPYGIIDQNDFLNGSLKLETLLTPEELLEVLHDLEQKAGRQREIEWGPRTLDLDIIFYDDVIMETDKVCIPYIGLQKKETLLKSLLEVAPYLHHPATGKSMREMLEDLE